MSLIELLLLSAALGVDCFVVSFCQGLVFKKNRTKNSLILASVMGLFQGFMPAISFLLTGIVIGYIQQYASLIVFGIFLILGCKFIYEAFSKNEECQICSIDVKCLLSMGIATSIDALGAGVGLKLTQTNLILAVIIIGTGSLILSLTGFWAGNLFKNLPSKYLEVGGGIILIGLAIKAIVG